LLRHIARQPTGDRADLPPVRYDPDRQISQVYEDGKWVDSWESRLLPGTKKTDHETGEDAKGQ
jgi:hypothetical protein